MPQQRPERVTRTGTGDVVLDGPALNRLILGVQAAFSDPNSATWLLREIGYPEYRMPNFDTNFDAGWREAFRNLGQGLLPQPYRQIFEVSLRVYRYHPAIRPLAEELGLIEPDGQEPAEPPASEPDAREPEPPPAVEEPAAPTTAEPATTQPAAATSWRVIVRSSSADDSRAAQDALGEAGLNPHMISTTSFVAGFRLDTDRDTAEARVREALGTEFVWTLIAPGEPDYLIDHLYFRGPDGSRYLMRQVPAAQPITDLASDLIGEHYGGDQEETSHSLTVDHIKAGEEGRTRVNPEDSLHDAGVRDQDTLVVGYQQNAGSVNPVDHDDGLYRARNEITAFEAAHDGFTVRANDPILPTEYELSFRERSFGPPEQPGGEPRIVEDHVVLMQLGFDFPRVAPTLWWETPIYHPNVAPNYDEVARRNPLGAGKVCLGVLGEAWHPSWDFGDLCQMLIDIAAYRSYSVEPFDYYNADAADWLKDNAEEIRTRLDGWPGAKVRRRDEHFYRNVIEKLQPGDE